MRDVAGRWQIRCEGGTETLELRPDGGSTYTIEAPRRRTKVEGTWSIEPPRERLAGARVILRKSPQSCQSADAGSNKAFSVERDSARKEQLLEPLLLVERGLDPQIGSPRQNAFCERQAFYLEVIELASVSRPKISNAPAAVGARLSLAG